MKFTTRLPDKPGLYRHRWDFRGQMKEQTLFVGYTKHPEALRLVEQYDHGDPVAHSNTWKTAVCNELRRLHAENATLQAGYDAARLEIDHLRGATKTVEPAHPVAWLVYLPRIDTQRVYDDQDDPGYLDDLTTNADAEVIPLYPPYQGGAS